MDRATIERDLLRATKGALSVEWDNSVSQWAIIGQNQGVKYVVMYVPLGRLEELGSRQIIDMIYKSTSWWNGEDFNKKMDKAYDYGPGGKIEAAERKDRCHEVAKDLYRTVRWRDGGTVSLFNPSVDDGVCVSDRRRNFEAV